MKTKITKDFMIWLVWFTLIASAALIAAQYKPPPTAPSLLRTVQNETNLNAKQTHIYHIDYRDCVRSNGTYQVRYEWDELRASIPLTNPPGQPHYDATISVWKNGVQIGTNMAGVYTEKGCFEDEPCHFVDMVLGISELRFAHLTNLPGCLAFKTDQITNFIPSVQWLGKIVIATDSDQSMTAGMHWLTEYEIGLRQDQVVVWRKARK